MFSLFRIPDDPNLNKFGAFPTDFAAAQSWNEKGYGIFWTPNTFKKTWIKKTWNGKEYDAISHRSLAGLTNINFWYCETDSSSKSEGRRIILQNSPIPPSMIVETKRGFHLYWKARDATLQNFNLITKNRLVPFFNADKRAADPCRLLRVPGFFHMKNPAAPFLVRTVFESDSSYYEREMLSFFPDVVSLENRKKEQYRRTMQKQSPEGADFWDKVWNLNCQLALEKLSGSHWVGGESFSFRRVGSGNLNILVNGKSTSCWLDDSNRIGSADGGGPTIAQWLRWYGTPWGDVVRCIKNELLR